MNDKNIKYIIVASRGRDLENPKNKLWREGVQWVQQLEVNDTGFTNSITHVSKDNWVLEMYD